MVEIDYAVGKGARGWFVSRTLSYPIIVDIKSAEAPRDLMVADGVADQLHALLWKENDAALTSA